VFWDKKSFVRRFLPMSIEKKQQLTAQQLGILNSEMEKHKKSTTVAYLLWFFLGSLGAHKFYLRNTMMGIIYLVLFILGAATTAIGIGFFFYGILGVLLLVDLFTIPRQIRKLYEKEEEKIIDRLLGTTTINTTTEGEQV